MVETFPELNTELHDTVEEGEKIGPKHFVMIRLLGVGAMGKVIFVVTHDYEFVCRTCSRVLHIDHGEQCDDLPLVPDNEENLKKLFSI